MHFEFSFNSDQPKTQRTYVGAFLKEEVMYSNFLKRESPPLVYFPTPDRLMEWRVFATPQLKGHPAVT